MIVTITGGVINATPETTDEVKLIMSYLETKPETKGDINVSQNSFGKRYKCGICKKESSTYRGIRIHQATTHEGARKNNKEHEISIPIRTLEGAAA